MEKHRNGDRRKKLLVNEGEAITDAQLHALEADWNARICPKIRVADVMNIESSGLSDEQYRYALQAHFDFVVCDTDTNPLFAVEFDGSSHQAKDAQRRDALKNQICKHFDFPLIRLDSRFHQEVDGFNLLEYVVDMFFLNQSFEEAQASGSISPFETFIPQCFMLPTPDMRGYRFNDPFAKARLSIKQAQQAGLIKDELATEFWSCHDGEYRGLAIVSISDFQVLHYETRVAPSVGFPCVASDLVCDFAIAGLECCIRRYKAGKRTPISLDQCKDLIIKGEYRMYTGFNPKLIALAVEHAP